ncbi:uncharacterized protein LOC132448295 isoform X2 [Gadus macrocephalus]|uniref:uncharacterized protein LOC132448295 isoform X2 n=1 Tax=Gadus macrocephalus TaxID=80720 RepID=UPI0028CB5BB5|nr:uncharacterized protein LOC132448295 isoform X2 [Gadus macrocephalus]
MATGLPKRSQAPRHVSVSMSVRPRPYLSGHEKIWGTKRRKNRHHYKQCCLWLHFLNISTGCELIKITQEALIGSKVKVTCPHHSHLLLIYPQDSSQQCSKL